MFVYSKLLAGFCWHPPPPPDIESYDSIIFPPLLSSYIFRLLSSHVIDVIPLCIYLDLLLHAFYIYAFPGLFCNSVCYVCDIFSDFLQYLNYLFPPYDTLSYIWLCRMKYPCIVSLKDNVVNSTLSRTRTTGCVDFGSNYSKTPI